MGWAGQTGYGVRFDWGPAGADAVAAPDGCLVVVDVLSFSTTVSVAVEAGMRVWPYPWRDERAARFAASRGAELAGGRRSASADQPWTLSPAGLRRAPFTERLVLPSPNGSAIAAAVTGPVVAACLRNAAAVGDWLLAGGYGSPARPISVVAAGERWTDGSLRPALEDLLGAGAVISALVGAAQVGAAQVGAAPVGGVCSPEAAVAAAAFAGCSDIAAAISACASGRELIEGGFADDVDVALELNRSAVVPLRPDGEAPFAAA